ncbi:MAG TPA: amidohydrolase, partial [Firmicutes bacterium]|nr:amidohydrolase [Bacillota bacterium]
MEIRRRIHSEPELGFREVKTTALVKKHLAELGLEVMDLGDTTGAAAILRGGKPGPVTGLRADLDALPIQEQTGLPFQSKNAGVMHACGHDGHTAMLLGAAMVLRELADEVPGTVKFVFQPAEELLQ